MTTEDETVRILANLEACPECGLDLVGEPIPATHREFFGGKTHGTKLVAVEVNDSTAYYECPRCHAHFDPLPPEPGVFRTSNVVVHRA